MPSRWVNLIHTSLKCDREICIHTRESFNRSVKPTSLSGDYFLPPCPFLPLYHIKNGLWGNKKGTKSSSPFDGVEERLFQAKRVPSVESLIRIVKENRTSSQIQQHREDGSGNTHEWECLRRICWCHGVIETSPLSKYRKVRVRVQALINLSQSQRR